MRAGYRIVYFRDGADWQDGVHGLPDGLVCDETLADRLESSKQFIQTWIEADDSNDLNDPKMRHLVEVGSMGEAPTMGSFGPNMSLARDLLPVDENQAVLEYFDACRKFWEFRADRLDEWAAYVKAALFPDFGANLVY